MENIQEEIEDKVIDCITFESGGRLVVFKPENSEADLAVEKKADYKKKVIYLKVVSKKEKIISANADREENFYFLLVSFDAVSQELGDKFLIMPQNISIDKKDFASFLLDKIEAKKK